CRRPHRLPLPAVRSTDGSCNHQGHGADGVQPIPHQVRRAPPTDVGATAMPDEGTSTITADSETAMGRGESHAPAPRGLLTLASDFVAVLGSRIASLFLSLATVVV